MNKRGFPGSSAGKESACNEGDPGSISVSGRSTGEGNGNSLQYSCMGNPWQEEPGKLQSMGLQKSRTPLSKFTVIVFGSIQDNTPSLLLNNNFPPLKNINSKLYQKIKN